MKKRVWEPPETRRFDNEDMELLGGNPANGFKTRVEALKLALEWKLYPVGGKARIVVMKGKYWVYGN